MNKKNETIKAIMLWNSIDFVIRKSVTIKIVVTIAMLMI